MTTGPRAKQLIVPGHKLRNEGAGYNSRGVMYLLAGQYDDRPNRGKCSCGALSEPQPSDAARKRWHREHKIEVLAAAEGEPVS